MYDSLKHYQPQHFVAIIFPSFISIAAFYTDLKSMGFKHALETCKQRNETVIFPSTAEEISELKFFMKSRGSHKAWILLTRTEFNIPRWEIRNSTGTSMFFTLIVLSHRRNFVYIYL